MKDRSALLLAFLLTGLAPIMAQTPSEFPPAEYEAMKTHGTLPANARPTQVHLDQAELDSIVASNGGWQRGGGGNEGLCGLWQDPNGCPLSQLPSDDGSSSLITLPFSFNLYGTNYTSLYINNNGNVTFNAPYSTFSAVPFPNAQFVMVAPFWADVMTNTTHGGVYYCLSAHALFVNWIDVGYFYDHYDKVNNFQLVLTDGTDDYIGVGNNVDFSYLDMQWTTGDVGGSNGFGSPAAVVGANLGNGTGYISIGKFDHAGTDYNGPNGLSGVSWLDYKDFVFSTTVASANIAPIATGNFVCDTVVVCTGVPAEINMTFLAPEPTQIITPTFSAPDFPQFNPTITVATTGIIDGILVPTVDQVGFHTITFTGTDNGTPNLSHTTTVTVQVVLSPNLGSSNTLFCDNDTAVDMLSLITGSPTPGGTWTDIAGQPVSNIFVPGTTPDGDYLYTVDNGGGCAATATATITNVPHAYAGEDTALAYCSWDYPDGLFQHLPGTPQAGGYWVDPNGMVFDGQVDPPTSTPGNYLYVVTPPTPCPNDTAVIIVAIPPAVYAGTDSSIVICRDAAPFSMRGKLGGQVDTTGTWTTTLGAAVPDTFDPATGEIGVYTYTVPAILPCPDQSATLTINIDPLPNAGIDSALVICANGGNYPLYPLLNGTTHPGSHWLDPLGNPHSGILDPSLELSGPYLYIAVGPGTCDHLTDTAVVDVHIDPLAVISFTSDPDSGCNPLEVTFTNTTDSIYVGNSCVWDLGDGTPTVQECASFTHTYQNAGWYHVKLQMTTPQGCTNQLIVPGAVLVDPAPLATFVWTPNPGTSGNSNIVFTGTDPHAVDFQWTIANDDHQSGQQVAHAFTDQIGGVYPVCLTVRDRYGCVDTLCDSVSVIIPNLYTPLAFTPDGNGVNDVFKPYITDVVASDYELRIFDRWGQLVFDTQDPEAGWDGKGPSGGILPTGTYIWRISYRPVYTSDKTDQYGVVTLIK